MATTGLELDTTLSLITDITPLGWGKGQFQVAIEPGQIGVLSIGGRVTDNNHQPLVFFAGDRPSYKFLASRLYGIPGLGRVRQQVIEFAENPGILTITIKRPLLGLSQGPDDPALVRLHASFKLVDPIALLNHSPDWDKAGGIAQTNLRLEKFVRDAAEAAIFDRMQDLSASPSYLASDDLNRVQSEFRKILQPILADWGLLLVESIPPTRQYPDGLTKVLYDVRLGTIAFQIELERDRQRAMHQIGLRAHEAELLQNLGPVAGFIDLANRNPQVAIKIIEAAGQQAATGANILKTLLLTQTPDALLSKQIVLSLLQQQAQSSPFAFLGQTGSPGSGGLQIGIAPSAGVPGLAGVQAQTTGVPLVGMSGPTVGLNIAFPQSPATSLPTLPDAVEAIAAEELSRLQDPGVEVDDLGIKNNDYRLEMTVDNDVTYRLRINSDFDRVGPIVDYVIVKGIQKRPADVPGLMPPWNAGDHLDVLITLVRSGHFH